MGEQYDNGDGGEERKYERRILIKEEKKELTTNAIKKISPFLIAMEEFRRESLDSKFRF